jgi:hypothetical protein
MKIIKAKQVRFQAVVAKAGAPHTFTPWGDPQKDSDFQKALNQERVMTIHGVNVGSRKEFGTVGFNEGANSTFLIFPKSLKSFEGARVIGVDFGKIEEEVPTDRVTAPSITQRKTSKQVAKSIKPEQRQIHPEKALKVFRAICTFTVKVTETKEFKATSLSEARKQLAPNPQTPDFTKVTPKISVRWSGGSKA